ncbi:blast:Heat shock protein 68 [Drosophila guanche]|uniref:Blast:Heat shock protein 68 n=1 Tax=Drosophila guanche TaxID=7266 RepID=A0A3B0KGF3_DROGU|nr:blast:Heat shock protein 68 [Drosophila guanche]
MRVTFDLDANGILNVTAKEMGSGNAKNITIKNDKGRLSQADIDRMLSEAEQYAEEDEKHRQRIAARNQLESYVFGVKEAADNGGDRISQSDKSSVLEKCGETIKWLEGNTTADKEEYEYKLKELTQFCSPIMTKMHQQQGAGDGPRGPSCGQQGGGFANGGYKGPTVEEVD